jgi:hypothetical protein
MSDNNSCILSIINQLDEQTTLKLYTLDEIREENNDKELIERINQLDENILTSQLIFPLEKGRSVQLHAHVEPNETDTKIDDELRQKDSKDLVIYRKFAKIAIRCFIKIKTNQVKTILVSFKLLKMKFQKQRFLFRLLLLLNIVLLVFRRLLLHQHQQVLIR